MLDIGGMKGIPREGQMNRDLVGQGRGCNIGGGSGICRREVVNSPRAR